MKTPKGDYSPRKPRPNVFDSDARSPSKKARDNEKVVANILGTQVTPGSGNQPWPTGKGDHKHPTMMFEQKETGAARLSIGERVIGKLCREAGVVGKDPVLIVSADLPDPLPRDWVFVPLPLFAEMLKAYEESEGI